MPRKKTKTSKDDSIIVKTLKDVQVMLDNRFEETKNVNYLQSKNVVEDAILVIQEEMEIKKSKTKRRKCICCGAKSIVYKGQEYDHYYIINRKKVFSRILNDDSQTEVFYDEDGNETGSMT